MYPTPIRFGWGVCAVGLMLGCKAGTENNSGSSALTIEMAPPITGDGQTGTVLQALGTPLSVLVTRGGKPRAGESISWSSTGTGGTISNPTVTNSDGIAQSTWRLAQEAGQQVATAELAGADGSPISFTATAQASTPVAFDLAAGDNQTQQAGIPFPDVLQVKVKDRFGNGVAGIAVGWTVTSGSVTLEVPSSGTGSGGIAGEGATAGASPGPAVVTATSLYGTVTFHLTVTGGTVTVELGDDYFKSTITGTQDPAIDTVAVGTVVGWTKSGTDQHHIVSTSGPVSFDSGLLKGGVGTGYSLTFNTAGSYTYHCTVHMTMTGEIVAQ